MKLGSLLGGAAGIVALALALRLVSPLADPPDRLTWSNGEVTDPPAIVHAARNAVLFGDPVRDDSKDLVFYPLLNVVTACAFQLFGAKRIVMVLLSVGFGTASIAALAWAIRRGGGGTAARTAALLAAVSFWIAMFSRIPVAENLVLLLLLVGAGFAFGSTTRDHVFAGVFLGVAACFGKVHALFAAPALVLFLWRRRGRGALAPFSAGFLGAASLWGLVVFLPARAEILDQLGRSTELYGRSPLMKSPIEAFLAPLRALRNSWFFLRFPLIAFLGGLFVATTLASREAATRRLASGAALFAWWVVSGWLALCLLGYQAPRYFLLVAMPLAACAAFQIREWRDGVAPALLAAKGVRANVVLLVWCIFVASGALEALHHGVTYATERFYPTHPELASSILVGTRGLQEILQPFSGCAAAALIVACAAYLLIRVTNQRRSTLPVEHPRLAKAALIALLCFDAIQFVDWFPRRAFLLEDARASYASIVGDDAVLYGGFAPAFVFDTRRVAVPLFGVPRSGAIEEFGVTHVVLGEPGDLDPFERAAPGLVDRLEPVQTWPYHTNHLRRLALYRVGPAPGDSAAGGGASLTAFERGAARLNAGDYAGAIPHFEEHRARFGDRTSDALSRLAECRLMLGEEEAARDLLERAVRLRSAEPIDLYNLGILVYRAGDARRARELWTRGYRIDPANPEIAEALGRTRP